MSVYCMKCGQECVPSASYCAQCGHKLATAPPAEPDIVIENAHVYVEQPPYGVEAPRRHWSPLAACLLSIFIPGLGQLYKGNIFSGLLWFMVVSFGYFLLIAPGMVLHLLCIIFATMGDPYE